MADETASIAILLEKQQKTLKDIESLLTSVKKLDGALSKLEKAKGPDLKNIQAARRQLKDLRQKALAAKKALGKGGLAGSVKFLGAAFSALALRRVALAFTDLIRSAIDVKRTFDGIEQTLKAVTGSSEELARAQGLVLSTSRRLGLEIVGLGTDYANFLASTKRLNLSQEEIEKIFISVSEAGRVLNLSQQRLNLTFLALSQIASKGIATMEELRRQLGDQLPGVFGRVADAMGLTTSALIEQIRQGKILAEEILPAIGQAARELAGGQVLEATQTLAANVARLSLEYQLFLKAVAEGGEESFQGAIDDARELISANSDVAASLGEVAGAIAKLGVATGGLALDQIIKLQRLVEGISEAFKELTGSELGGAFERFIDSFVRLQGHIIDAVVGAEDTEVAFKETWASIKIGSESSGKSLETLAREAGRVGEEAARSAGEVERSGQRIILSVEESVRRIAIARERAKDEVAGAAGDALASFLLSLQQQVRAAGEAFNEQVRLTRDLASEQLKIRSRQTSDLIAEFQETTLGFEIAENDRVKVAKEVSDKLLELSRNTARERAEVQAEAFKEADTASAEEREKILKDSAKKLLEAEEKAQEKRLEIVSKGLGKLEKLETKRAEFVIKELAKIEKAEEKLAKKREKLLEESGKAVREFFKTRAEALLGAGADEGADRGRANRLKELQDQLFKLQTRSIVSTDVFDEISALKEKISNLKGGFDEFGKASGAAFNKLGFDIRAFSEAASKDLLDLIDSESFKQAFNELTIAEQQFAKSAIFDFQLASRNFSATEQDVRGLLEAFGNLSLVGPKIGDLSESLEKLGQPTNVDEEFSRLAERTKELGGAAEAAAPALDKVDTAVKGVAEAAPQAAEGLEAIGVALEGQQDAIDGFATGISSVSETLPEVANSLLTLSQDVPAILDRLAQANEDGTLGIVADDIDSIVSAIADSQEGLTALAEGLEALLEAGENTDVIKRLAAAIEALGSESIVTALISLSEAMVALGKDVRKLAVDAEKMTGAFRQLSGPRGVVAMAREAFDEFSQFLTQFFPVLERLRTELVSIQQAIVKLGTEILRQISDWERWGAFAIDEITRVGVAVTDLESRIDSLSASLSRVAQRADELL